MFNNEISKCCKEPLMVEGGDEGTKYYICGKCRKPSDPVGSVSKNKHSTGENHQPWEEELRKTLLAWINKSDVNYRLADEHHGAGYTVDIDDLMSQVAPFYQQAREEAIRECVEAIKKLRINPLPDVLPEEDRQGFINGIANNQIHAIQKLEQLLTKQL